VTWTILRRSKYPRVTNICQIWAVVGSGLNVNKNIKKPDDVEFCFFYVGLFYFEKFIKMVVHNLYSLK
jgi:hypothetical protein